MRTFSYLTGLLSLVGGIQAVATSSRDLMESLRAVPQGWKQVGSPRPDQWIHLRIALSSPNQGLFEETLLAVSSPDHAKYGQHLKRDELKAMLRPAPEATEAVLKWLASAGIAQKDIVDDGEWINFLSTIAQAEDLLDTKFGIYRSTVKNVDKIRTLHYSVPESLHQYVDMVQPTTRFGQIKPQISQVFEKEVIGPAGSGLNVTYCNTTITPTCLRELYRVPENYYAQPNSGNLLGITGFLEEYARYADLATFEREYAPWMNGKNFSWVSVNGGLLNQTSEDDSAEANLDIQYAMALGYNTNTVFYSTAGRGLLVPDLDQPNQEDNANEPYLDFLNYIVKLPDHELPKTLSTSYGEDEQSVPEQYSRTVCNMFGQLGARGVSVIFSSGDTGVGSACQTNDGKNTTRFLPTFPASCPWVTSVGGTHYVRPESAIYFSSGGFSDRFPRPAYQAIAVPRFLRQLGDRWKGLYNPYGRGIPDIAAQGSRFRIVDQGQELSIGGTSASAPTIAGIITLLNNARLNAGKPPMGFLNPWLYTVGWAGLTDIVNGGSTGCTGKDMYSGLPTPFVPYASWNATKGWDPVTGLGTPLVDKLLKLSGGSPKGIY